MVKALSLKLPKEHFLQWCKGKSLYPKLPIFFFRSVTFFSLIWKNFSFSDISYLCLKVLYLERIFSRCTHQAHTVFYFELWGIFKSAFFDQMSHMPDVCTYCCLIAVYYKSISHLFSVINWVIPHHFLIMFLIPRNWCI